jgi:hypothetical protein
MDRDRLRTFAGLGLAVVVVVAFGLARVGGVGGVGGEPAPTCEDPVAWDDTSLRAGQRTAVTGSVARATFEPDVGGAPTFLNLGNAYPDPDRFDVVIYEEVGDRFDRRPDRMLRGRTLCVQGQVRDREGVLQIILEDPAYLTVTARH